MTREPLCAACVLWGAVVLADAQAPAQPQTVFRTGIDVVQLDVSVLDKAHRPVRGLTAADFTVFEADTPQPIVAFSAVDVPDPVDPSAAWMREVTPDVVSNDTRARRLVIIVMDDAYSSFDPAVATTARTIAKNAVNQLGPADLAAVAFTFTGRPQNFTTDRAQLLAAVESFTPKRSGGGGPPLACSPQLKPEGCDVETLSHVGAALRTAPPGRKTVIFIGSGRNLTVDADSLSRQLEAVQEMFRSLQQANVTVYAFDPNGLQTLSPSAAEPSPSRVPFASNETLYSFAASTGGRAISNTNAPEALVRDVFVENSSYYLLGFRSTGPPADGRFRKIRVKVNRPGVEVRTRSGYYAPKTEKPGKTTVPALSPLDAAVANGLPGGEIPLRASAAAFAVPGRREAEVVVVVAGRESTELPASPRIDVIAAAFDKDFKPRGAHRQTIEVRPPEASALADPPAAQPRQAVQYEVTSRLPLAPGRYEIRVAADSAGRTGNVFVDVDVPNFAKDDVSLSGLLLERAPPPDAGRAALADLVPVIPTTARDFTPADRVAGFVRMYQGGTERLRPAHITSRIVDDRDQTVFEQTVPFDGELFDQHRAADYHLDLPLARLAPGQYLLTIEATIGNHRARRDVRFTLVGPGS